MPCNCLARLAVIPVAQDTHYQTTFPYKHEPSQQSKAKQANVADWINHQEGSLWRGPANLHIGPNLSQLRQTSQKSCLTWHVWFLFPFLKDFVCTLFHIIPQCSTLPFWHLSSSHGNQTVVNQSNHHCINNTMLDECFCDSRNNQGRGECS